MFRYAQHDNINEWQQACSTVASRKREILTMAETVGLNILPDLAFSRLCHGLFFMTNEWLTEFAINIYHYLRQL